MTESELDGLYTHLCRTMTELGERRTPLFLARFALLAISRIDDAATARRLIGEARDGLNGPDPDPEDARPTPRPS